MLEQTFYDIPGIFDQAIQRFLQQFDEKEVQLFGKKPKIRAELRQVEWQGTTEVRPVLVIQCEGVGHRCALLYLKDRIRKAAANVGITSIGLAVSGTHDIGFFCH
jgi:hypothetical protein